MLLKKKKNSPFFNRNIYNLSNYHLPLIGKHLHSIAFAASGYQKVLEENRKLYNQVQDLKGKIQVIIV